MDSDQELEDYISSLSKKLHLPSKQSQNHGKKEIQSNNIKSNSISFLKKSSSDSIKTNDLAGHLLYTNRKKDLSDVLQRANDLMTKYRVGNKMGSNSALTAKSQAVNKPEKKDKTTHQKKISTDYLKALETIPSSESDISISSESNYQESGAPVNEINSANENSDIKESDSDDGRPFSLLKRGSIQWFNDDEVIEEVSLDDIKVPESKANVDSSDKEDSSSSAFYGQHVQLNMTDLSSNISQDMGNAKIKENSDHELNLDQSDIVNVEDLSYKKEIALEIVDSDIVQHTLLNSSESIAEDFDIMSESIAEDKSVNSSEHSLKISSKVEVDASIDNTSSASVTLKESPKEYLVGNKDSISDDYSLSNNSSTVLKNKKTPPKVYKKHGRNKTKVSHLKHRFLSHPGTENEGKVETQIKEARINSSFHSVLAGPSSNRILNTLVVMQEAKVLSEYQPGLLALKNMLHMEMDRHEHWYQKMKELYTSISKFLPADYSYTTWEETKQILKEGRKKIRKRTLR